MLKSYFDIELLADFFAKRPEPIPIGSEYENRVWSNLWNFLKSTTELHLNGNIDKSNNNIFLTQLTSGRGEAPIYLESSFKKPNKNTFPKEQDPYCLFFINEPDELSQRKYKKSNGFFFGFADDYYDEWKNLNLEDCLNSLPVRKHCKGEGFTSWGDLEKRLFVFSDMILCDNYILRDRSMWENNLIKLLKTMAKKAPSKFNLLIYSFEGERHDLFLEITDIYETLKHNLIDEGIVCDLGIVLAPTQFKYKARTIFTNYLHVKSDDTFNYFNSAGEIITKGTDIQFRPLTTRESLNLFKQDLLSLHQFYSDLLSNQRYRDLYTRGNMRNRLFDMVQNEILMDVS